MSNSKELDQAFALHQHGDFAKAELAYLDILKIYPDNLRAHFLLAALYCQTRRGNLAVPIIKKVLNHEPKNTEAWNVLASALQQSHLVTEAIEAYEKVLALNLNHESACINLGNIFRNEKNYPKAIECFLQALKINPGNDIALSQLAHTHRNTGDSEAAINCFKQALKINPENIYAMNGLGLVYKDRDEHALAIDCYQRILRKIPNQFEALCNLAVVHRIEGQLDEALNLYNKAIEINPQNAEARVNRSIVYLLKEDFVNGWPEYEWRLKTPQHAFQNIYRFPRWNGEILKSGTLLIHGEQGVSDEILFASTFPDIENLGISCLVECDLRLVNLFSRSFPKLKFRGRQNWGETTWTNQFPDITHQIPSGSLFGLFRKSITDFPSRSGYLVPDQNKVKKWQEKLAQSGQRRKIGISWKSGATSTHDPNPAIRAKAALPLASIAELLKLPDSDFYCLQHGDIKEDLTHLSKVSGKAITTFPELDLKNDFDETTALIDALDMVIGIQATAAMHAAATGKNTWIATNREAGYFFGLTRETPLLFANVKLFRQKNFGRWDNVISEMIKQV